MVFLKMIFLVRSLSRLILLYFSDAMFGLRHGYFLYGHAQCAPIPFSMPFFHSTCFMSFLKQIMSTFVTVKRNVPQ